MSTKQSGENTNGGRAKGAKTGAAAMQAVLNNLMTDREESKTMMTQMMEMMKAQMTEITELKSTIEEMKTQNEEMKTQMDNMIAEPVDTKVGKAPRKTRKKKKPKKRRKRLLQRLSWIRTRKLTMAPTNLVGQTSRSWKVLVFLSQDGGYRMMKVTGRLARPMLSTRNSKSTQILNTTLPQ